MVPPPVKAGRISQSAEAGPRGMDRLGNALYAEFCRVGARGIQEKMREAGATAGGEGPGPHAGIPAGQGQRPQIAAVRRRLLPGGLGPARRPRPVGGRGSGALFRGGGRTSNQLALVRGPAQAAETGWTGGRRHAARAAYWATKTNIGECLSTLCAAAAEAAGETEVQKTTDEPATDWEALEAALVSAAARQATSSASASAIPSGRSR